MIAKILSASHQGLNAYPVEVEVDVSLGLPRLAVVGLPDQAVKEAKERVRAAIKNSGYSFPSRKITVNLAPADVKKEGPSFDLPIALGILAATEIIPVEKLSRYVFLGELALDGSLRKIRGALVLTSGARQGFPIIFPDESAAEASVEKEALVFSAGHLREVVDFLQGKASLKRWDRREAAEKEIFSDSVDFSEVKGQVFAKRAIEVAVAGGHNLLFVGPPGSGKTMLARRIPTILPSLMVEEAIEITKIYSVAGLTPESNFPLVKERPFRAPHSSTSQIALIGGGSWPRPGEISLAHGGVLFLDEFPEFRRDALEALRGPLEEGEIRISRAKAQWTFPARFMLVCAMNPCPCGWLGDPRRPCHCSFGQIQKYHAKISGPILDRIDLHIEVPSLSHQMLLSDEIPEGSAVIRERILEARERQRYRFSDKNFKTNHSLRPKELKEYCRLDSKSQHLIGMAIRELGLSARGYFKILKISRTIADLAESEQIQADHIAEAIQYRSLDRQRWG